MNVQELLQFMVTQNISDIHFKANCSPLIRVNGKLISAKEAPFTPQTVQDIAFSVMNEAARKRFDAEGELDMSYATPDGSRFRVNVYRQKGTLALSLRVIPAQLRTFEQLNLPAATLQKLCASPSGLILIAGVTGAGKT